MLLAAGHHLVLLVLPLALAKRTTTLTPGAPSQAEVLGDKELGIVHFAVSQIAGGGKMGCPREIVKIENFMSQLVAGMLYEFDVSIGPTKKRKKGCAIPRTQKCHMSVWEKLDKDDKGEDKEVVWDNVKCTGNIVPAILQVPEDLLPPDKEAVPKPGVMIDPPMPRDEGDDLEEP